VTANRHEIPTHLNVEDKAFYGLSARQFTFLMAGLASAYGLWQQWPDLPLSVRLALAGCCLLLTAALTLIRPHGRGLEEWAFVFLHYLMLPKLAVWRPCPPEPDSGARSAGEWEEFAPCLSWTEGEEVRGSRKRRTRPSIAYPGGERE
jgi:hypothetical protein